MCSCNCRCSGEAISVTYSECVYSLSYPACNEHVPYYLWPVPLYCIFAHYLVKGTIFFFWGGLLNTKYVLIFFTTFI